MRLLLTFISGAIIGMNRGEHQSPAGLRTTILVCLTASASMILGNLSIGTSGRSPNSFVTMDVMRLPSGILTGMGFIGAGAILHKGNMVVGVTTAATLWFTTLMGFCFGAGEPILGVSLLGVGSIRPLMLGVGRSPVEATSTSYSDYHGFACGTVKRGDRARGGTEWPQAFPGGGELHRRNGRSPL